jgi:hypothetical protein
MPWMEVEVRNMTRTETSSTEEEDVELKHEKANGKVISILPRDTFSLPALAMLGKMSCATPGVNTPCAAHTANDKGARVHMSDSAGQTTGNSKIS